MITIPILIGHCLTIALGWNTPPPRRNLCMYLEDGRWEYPIPNPAWRGDKRKVLARECASPSSHYVNRWRNPCGITRKGQMFCSFW